ncbi:MAG: PAS domain S-box protein, partial [Pseudobdellovibrionaceae bacterium]
IGIQNASSECSRLRLAQDQGYKRRLQQSEERFRILVEGVKDHAIVRTDISGVIQDWNSGAENITGWKYSEVIGKQGSILFTPQDLASGEDKKEMITARETGKAEDNRWHIKKNGSRFFAIGAMNPLWDAAGNLTGYVKVFRDFTEKRHEHLKFEEESDQVALSREEMYQLIMQAPVAMVLFAGPDHRFILANPPYEKMVGRNVTGRTVLEAFNKEEVELFIPLLNRVYETGQPYIGTELPLSIPNESGKIESRYVNLGYHPFRDSNGRIKGIFAVVQDVTEQVLARKSVEESEARFRQLANALPLIVWTANSDGYVDWYNDWWYEYLNQPRGTEWDDPKKSPMHPDDVARTKVIWPQVLSTGSQYIIEQRFRRGSDGEYRWHLVRGVPIRDEAGKVVKYIGGNTDIHDQKILTEQLAQAVNEVKEREESFRAIFDRAASGIARVSLDGHWNMVNHRLTEIFKYSASELSTKTSQEMTHPDDIDLELKRIDEMKAGDYNSFSMEKRYRRKDGSYVWVNLTKSLVRDESGSPKGFVAVIEDISARKRLEEDLQNAKQSADSANQLKTAFLANMSHEIRTPIGVIQGFADLLADESLQTEQRKWVEIIRRNTRQLTSLIGEILDLSKVEADKLEIENISFRLSDLAEDLRSSMTFKAEEKGLAFFVDLDPNLPQFVVSDPTRLRQILINLTGNAIKFTETGFVKVQLGRSASKKNQLMVQVRDTGIGLSEDQKQKIFDPFVQADTSMTRRFGGTGLGLSISKKLAQALGGDLIISKSQPGFGSIFELTVCCLQDKMEKSNVSGKAASRETVDFTGRRILLIEDSQDNRVLIERMLLETHAEFFSEPNGKLGAERATREKFDVVLMDIQMPEMDGHQAIEFLRTTGYDKPVIALTAHALKEEKERAASLGFNGYVTKPILKKSLLRAIQNCLTESV